MDRHTLPQRAAWKPRCVAAPGLLCFQGQNADCSRYERRSRAPHRVAAARLRGARRDAPARRRARTGEGVRHAPAAGARARRRREAAAGRQPGGAARDREGGRRPPGPPLEVPRAGDGGEDQPGVPRRPEGNHLRRRARSRRSKRRSSSACSKPTSCPRRRSAPTRNWRRSRRPWTPTARRCPPSTPS